MRQKVARWGIYLLGNVVVALGLTLNTKTDLGTSCIMSVPYVVSQVSPLNVGNAVMVVFILLILIQMALHIPLSRRTGEKLSKLWIMDALQFVQNLVFSRIVNLFDWLVPVFRTAWPDGFLGSVWFRLLVAVFAIICVGLGAICMLNMRLVLNPGDGIVQVLSDFTGKPVGFTKNWVDALCVVIALAVGLLFGGRVIGIGVGTLMAALGTGRVMALGNRLWRNKMCRAAGLAN